MKYEDWEKKHFRIIDGKKSCLFCDGGMYICPIKKRFFGNSKRKHWELYHTEEFDWEAYHKNKDSFDNILEDIKITLFTKEEYRYLYNWGLFSSGFEPEDWDEYSILLLEKLEKLMK